MLPSQIKDVIREHFGRLGFPTVMVDLALEEGRKLIEKEANFWWMEAEATFSLVVDDADYVIAASGGSITIPNFKDAQALQWKRSTDVRWEAVSLGDESKDALDVMYDTDDEGWPEAAVIKDMTLFVYPPKPQETYNMKLYYYGYTTHPASNVTTTDELCRNWAMALVYAALVWGYEIYLKDMQGATYWRTLLMGNPANKVVGEITKLKRENLKRGWKSQIVLVPHTSPRGGIRQRLDNLKLYVRR